MQKSTTIHMEFDPAVFELFHAYLALIDMLNAFSFASDFMRMLRTSSRDCGLELRKYLSLYSTSADSFPCRFRFKVFDSKVILQYLEDKYPEHPLLPKDPKDRAEARMIEEVCDTGYEAINWGMSEVFWSQRATGELADKLQAKAREQTAILVDWLSSKLGDKMFFNGDTFGFADICVAPYVNRSFLMQNGPAEGSKLAQWRERVLEIPSVKETTEEMQAAAKQMQAAFKDLFKAGSGRKREYRDHRLEWVRKLMGRRVCLWP